MECMVCFVMPSVISMMKDEVKSKVTQKLCSCLLALFLCMSACVSASLQTISHLLKTSISLQPARETFVPNHQATSCVMTSSIIAMNRFASDENLESGLLVCCFTLNDFLPLNVPFGFPLSVP